MKRVILFILFTMWMGLCACSDYGIEDKIEMTTSSKLSFSNEEQKIDFNIYFDNGGGYVDISNEEFINKATKVDKTTTYEELIVIFGKEPGDIEELAHDEFFYRNDNYLLRYNYGFGVVLFEFSNPQDYIVID